ncbi:MAG: ASPIC/UnbV protein [Myxococcaceae bacterium]|nr:ASPIC/UnbV protein [Myxococcaceae bacterium]
MSKRLARIALPSILVVACSSSSQPAGVSAAALCHAPESAAVACAAAPGHLAEGDLEQDFFKDVFEQVGLAGKLGRRVTFGDVDGDGYPDFVAIETGVTRGLQHLYMNRPGPNGTRVFVDATTESGITKNREGGDGQTALMVAFGDVDGDGDLDLFSASYSQAPTGAKLVQDSNEIYVNDGKGHFTLSMAAGVDKPWPLTTAAATFVDYDLDGKLDLFVGNFMVAYPDDRSYQNNLFRNAGDGTFTRVNDEAGITTNKPVGSPDGMYTKPTYGVTACDWNDDGWPDLLTSTYALGKNDLWKNLGNGRFENASRATTYDMDDQPNPGETESYRQGGNNFAAACADYDNDGDLDVMTATTTHGDSPRSTADRSRILRNTGPANGFVFERPPMSETGIDRKLNVGGPNGDVSDEGDHGVSWLDFDNDGLLDMVIEQSAYPGNHAWLYHQRPDHSFENVTELSGIKSAMGNSNGLTVDDYDRDGDLDILIGSVNTGSQTAPGGVEQVHLFENQVGNRNGFVTITLKGKTANSRGIGARIKVTAGCLTQMREISGGKGTFGAADPAYAHFGLGTAKKIDQIEIRWPTNPPKIQIVRNVGVNQFVEITEDSDAMQCTTPEGAAKP